MLRSGTPWIIPSESLNGFKALLNDFFGGGCRGLEIIEKVSGVIRGLSGVFEMVWWSLKGCKDVTEGFSVLFQWCLGILSKFSGSMKWFHKPWRSSRVSECAWVTFWGLRVFRDGCTKALVGFQGSSSFGYLQGFRGSLMNFQGSLKGRCWRIQGSRDSQIDSRRFIHWIHGSWGIPGTEGILCLWRSFWSFKKISWIERIPEKDFRVPWRVFRKSLG